MKEELLSYKGFLNKEFCFSNEFGKLIKFNKARADLVYDFELQEKKNVNKKFLARYFIDFNGGREIYILSDLHLDG